MLKATGIVGTVLVILALVISLLKQVIAFIGFITFAVKILIVLVFAFVIIAVGLMVFRSLSEKKKNKS